MSDVATFRRWFRELLQEPQEGPDAAAWPRRFELEDMRAALRELEQEEAPTWP